jgi:hypothetical protein
MKKKYDKYPHARAWPTNPDFTEYAIFGVAAMERVRIMHVRVTNCLRQAGINSLDELLQWKESELRRLPNLGRIGMVFLTDCLAAGGYKLKEEGE